MKVFKKIVIMLLVCFLTVFVITACKEKPNNNGDNHTHTAGEEWLFDKDSHWKVCVEDGEKVDSAAHTLENEKCTVCGVKVKVKDNLTDVYVLDKKGNWTVCVHYDGENKVSEETIEYEYLADGNIKSMKIMTDGKLTYEAEYGVDDEGFNYEKSSTQYNEDGTKYYTEFDNKGDMLKETMYKADGTVEYDYTHVYTYGDNAQKTSEKIYSGEKLVKEINYIVLFIDTWGGGSYKLEVITYNDDGTKTVEYFTENGEPYTE